MVEIKEKHGGKRRRPPISDHADFFEAITHHGKIKF